MEIITSKIHGHACLLHPERAVYFPESSLLVISDVHLGKVAHFRKNGMGLPPHVMDKNFSRLQAVIDCFSARRVVFLGDLFHSERNASFRRFGDFRQMNKDCDMLLVRGNHDLYTDSEYAELQVELCDQYRWQNICFQHEPPAVLPEEDYVIYGHIHPGIRLKESNGRVVRFPVFCLGKQRTILPAFGEFTGLHCMETKEDDRLYVLAEKKIVEINQ